MRRVSLLGATALLAAGCSLLDWAGLESDGGGDVAVEGAVEEAGSVADGGGRADAGDATTESRDADAGDATIGAGDADASDKADATGGDAVADAMADADGAGTCTSFAALAPFDPTGLNINTAFSEVDGRLSPDQKTLYFARDNGSGYRLWVATLNGGVWTARKITELDLGPGSDASDRAPFPSADGKTLYFASTRNGSSRIYSTLRDGPDAGWRAPTSSPLTLVDAAGEPSLSDDAHLYFVAEIPKGGIWVVGTDAGNPARVITSDQDPHSPVLTGDGGLLLYSSNYAGSTTVWRATRLADGGYGDATPGPNVAGSTVNWPTWISADGCTVLVAALDDAGKGDLYISSGAQ